MSSYPKVLFGLGLFAILLASCSNSIESDARKVAEFQCKIEKLSKESAGGDMSTLTEASKLASEFSSLENEMRGKYTTPEDQKKFAEALLKEAEKCK